MSHSGTALIDPYVVFGKIGLAEGMRVADLGCGRTGHFVFPASKVVGDRGIVYAVEIVKNILESIKSRARSEGYFNVQAVWADIERTGKIPIPDNSLQSCFLVNVLYLVKDKASALKEAMRLVEKNGTVIIVDWEKRLGELGPKEEMMVRTETAIGLAQKIGLSLVDNFSLSNFHYCLVFKK